MNLIPSVLFMDIYGKWWTNVLGKTDTTGCYSVKGFLGDYEIEVVMDGISHKVNVNLVKEPVNLEIIL